MKFYTRIKNEWSNLLLGDLTPHQVALGLAIGTFVALLPTFGFSILLSLLLIFIFPHINRPAVFFALMLWNPITQIPIYALSYQLGTALFYGMPMVEYNFEMLNQLYSFSRRFLVGHLLIVSLITILTYLTTIYYFHQNFSKTVKK